MPTRDSLPPHEIEAERGMLGAILMDSALVMTEVRHLLPPEAFYDTRLRQIWDTACEIHDKQQDVNQATVVFAMRKAGNSDEVFTFALMEELIGSCPSVHQWPTMLEVLQNQLILRRLLQHGADVSSRAMDKPENVSGLLNEIERESLAIRQYATPKAEFVNFKEMRRKTLSDYEDALSHEGRKGLKTGFPDLDLIIGGLREQEFIIVAGTPSAGKTSLALNIARNAALQQNTMTGMVSLETSGFKLVHRLNCIVSGASGSRLLNGRPIQSDMDKLTVAANDLKIIGERVLIYDRGANHSAQAVAMMRRMYAKGCRLFILDYLQLLDAPQKTSNGNERMTLVSKAMKAAAKELDCPIIAISSLNRQSAKDGRAPTRTDLRETGQLEFDADVIILLHSDGNNPSARTVSVNVDKNKDGETGKCELTFFPPSMQFESAAKINESDIPRRQHEND